MESHVRAPRIISIAATSRCNLRCVMCDHGVRRVEKQDFNPELLDQIGAFFAQADVVDLTGLGEPMLSDFFWKTLARFPREPGKHQFLMFNTNGTLLNDKNIARILQSRVRRMRVSIDAADEQTFFNIRGTPLQPIVEGLRRLVEQRNAMATAPLIGIETTVMASTIDRVIPMIDLAKSLGVDFFEAWSLNEVPADSSDSWNLVLHRDRNRAWWNPMPRKTFRYSEEMLSRMDRKAIRSKVAEWKAYAEQKGVPAGFVMLGEGVGTADYPYESWSLSDPVSWEDNSIRCALPWSELRTDYSGNVTACCWGPRPIASLTESTMEQIWTGPAMQEMRSDLVGGRVPRLCEGSACQFVNKRSD